MTNHTVRRRSRPIQFFDRALLPIWAAAFLLIFLDAASWAFARHLSPVTPGLVMEAFAGVGILTFAFSMLTGAVPRRRYPWAFLLTIAAYMLMCIVSFAGPGADRVTLVYRLAFGACCIGFVGLIAATANFGLVIAMLRWAEGAACVLNLIDNFAPHLFPVALSDFPGRAAGFYQNPNGSGIAIAVALPLVVWGVRPRLRLAMYAITLGGIALTQSRGGLVLWVVAVALTSTTFRAGGRKAARFITAGICFGALMIVLSLYKDVLSVGLSHLLNLDQGIIDRYFNTHDFSAQDRRYGLSLAWEAFLKAPWFGNGIGFYWSWQFVEGPHNMVLLTLGEFGLVGAVWMVAFGVSLVRFGSRLSLAAAGVFLTAAMFSQNLFDDAKWSLLLALYWMFAKRVAVAEQEKEKLRPRRRQTTEISRGGPAAVRS